MVFQKIYAPLKVLDRTMAHKRGVFYDSEQLTSHSGYTLRLY